MTDCGQASCTSRRAWWDDYYTPMLKRLPGLREKYADSPDALAMFDDCDTEMAIHKKHSKWYGYEFFVCGAE